MIPEAKKDAVARALREAFGVTGLEDIRMLTAGLSSALVFRIAVGGRPYLLRVLVSTDSTPGPGRGDPTNQFACMRKAAEAGIAPRVWYTSIEDRVSITDFVKARPFPRAEALARLSGTLRTLHALPPFPLPKVMNYLDALDGFVRKFQAARILPESETEELFETVRRRGERLPASRAGPRGKPQRFEARKHPFRRRPRLAGGLGGRLRPACRLAPGRAAARHRKTCPATRGILEPDVQQAS